MHRAAIRSHQQVCRRAELAQLRRSELNDTELQCRRSDRSRTLSDSGLKNEINCSPNAVHCSLRQLR
jgi:hypothetical protein